MYILSREPPSQSSVEDLPPGEPFRDTLTMAGSAESPAFCCTVMNNTSKSEKTLSAYETLHSPGSTQTSLSLLGYWCVELQLELNDFIWSIDYCWRIWENSSLFLCKILLVDYRSVFCVLNFMSLVHTLTFLRMKTRENKVFSFSPSVLRPRRKFTSKISSTVLQIIVQIYIEHSCNIESEP